MTPSAGLLLSLTMIWISAREEQRAGGRGGSVFRMCVWLSPSEVDGGASLCVGRFKTHWRDWIYSFIHFRNVYVLFYFIIGVFIVWLVSETSSGDSAFPGSKTNQYSLEAAAKCVVQANNTGWKRSFHALHKHNTTAPQEGHDEGGNKRGLFLGFWDT